MKNIYYFFDGSFYPPDISYKTIPEAAIPVSEEGFLKAMSRSPGETFTVDDKGIVTITEVPPITHEQQVAHAENLRGILRSKADAEISWRQDAVDQGIATQVEKSKLSEWKKYRILLMRVDTASAPGVEWPEPPV